MKRVLILIVALIAIVAFGTATVIFGGCDAKVPPAAEKKVDDKKAPEKK